MKRFIRSEPKCGKIIKQQDKRLTSIHETLPSEKWRHLHKNLFCCAHCFSQHRFYEAIKNNYCLVLFFHFPFLSFIISVSS